MKKHILIILFIILNCGNYTQAQDNFYKKGQQALENKNYAQAITFFEHATESGNSKAMVALGTIYEGGKGTEIDLIKATYWYEKAFENGSGIAGYRLGKIYQGKKQMKDALACYYKAIELGNSNAAYEIAMIYYEGKGVEKNYDFAREWFIFSANEGNATSMRNLGKMCENGEGMDENLEEAVKWYQKAVKNGNEKAESDIKRVK